MLTFAIACLGLAAPISALEEPFLPNWMGHVWPAIKNLTLLDLSLPGSHDTLTFDLSTTVADGGFDDPDLAKVLNGLGGSLVGEFIKPQAQTQGLNVTAQLDNGIRFLDFRIMLTGGDWRGLHCVQTNGKVLDFLKEARAWMDAHPTEILVFWLSKHGSECKVGNDQYPGVSQAEKRAFWKNIEGVFGSLLVDQSLPVNTTTVDDLILNGQRALMYVSDYVEFTDSSPKALDGCLLENHGPIQVQDEATAFPAVDEFFLKLPQKLEANKKVNKFELTSFAQSQGTSVIEDLAKLRFIPLAGVMDIRRTCASQFKFPNFTDSPWCPATLLEVAQLSNFYNQIFIDAALALGWRMPNAIYIDAVDVGGTLRVGPRRLTAGAAGAGGKSQDDPTCVVFKYTSCNTHQPDCDDGYIADGHKERWNTYDSDGNKHGLCGLPWQNHYRCCRMEPPAQDTARYAYVDALVLYNVNLGCSQQSFPSPANECHSLQWRLQNRLAQFPVNLWDDVMTGRFSNWPARPWTAGGRKLQDRTDEASMLV